MKALPMFVVALWLVLNFTAAGAQPLSEGYQALDAGDLAECRRIFAQAKGEDGSLARARLALTLGNPDQAVEELQGDSIPVQITRLEALCEARRYTEALPLLRKLELLEHGAFSPPWDVIFYRFRGRIERLATSHELALKNFELALTRSRTADERCLIRTEELALWLAADDLEKATEVYESAQSLIPQLKSTWTLTSFMEMSSRYHWIQGDLVTAVSFNRACRELYLAHNNPIRAALSLSQSARLLNSTNPGQQFPVKEQALQEFLKVGADQRTFELLDEMSQSFFDPQHQARLQKLYRQILSETQSGYWHQRIQLSFASFLMTMPAEEKARAEEICSELIQSQFGPVRHYAHLALARLARARGDYEKARQYLDTALDMSTDGMMFSDRDWRLGKGFALLRLGDLEKNRHHYEAAIALIEQAVQECPGKDWTFWRTEARHLSLMSAVESLDFDASEAQLEATFQDIEALDQQAAKSTALTLILSSLLINQSLSDDVLEPHTLILGEYGAVAKKLLRGLREDLSRVQGLVSVFDAGIKTTTRRKDYGQLAIDQIHKGLFLESLGQVEEAGLVLDSALELADQHQVLFGQVLGNVCRARVCLLLGQRDRATDHMTLAAQLSRGYNSGAARFWLLAAGGAERESGRLEQALESYSQALKLRPERGWHAYYGRALTWEKLGRPVEALADLALGLEQVEKAGLTVSKSQMQAAQARLLMVTQRTQEAATLFAEVHSVLLELGAVDPVYQVTTDYLDCLESLDRKQQALDLACTTLDRLSDWQALSFPKSDRLLERTIALVFSMGKPEAALKYLQLSHSAELLNSVELDQVPSSDPRAEALLKEVSELRQRLVALGQQSVSVGSGQSIGTLLADTRQEFFAKLNELKRTEPDFENLVGLSGSQLSSIQDLLSPESALIEFFPAHNTLYLFVVTKKRFTVHQVSMSRRELESLVSAYLVDCSNPKRPMESLKANSAKLRRILIGAAGGSLVGMKNLRIVPSGPLWNVSFSSLLNEQGRALVSDYEVSYVTSSDLARIRRSGEDRSVFPQRPLLVMGSTDLKGAQLEIQNLSAQFAQPVVLSEASVTKPKFLSQVEGKELIHIASHSTVSAQSGQTYVQLGSDRLTLEEIYGLELFPSSLVVLSSCRSGVSADPPGKDVTSLASAFSVAGASTVVASRWKVDDQTTAEFFGHFYDSLKKGKLRGQAFREAELAMASRHPHPYFWAGFSLMGDPD